MTARFGVWCAVWGGVTGSRADWLKSGDSRAEFATLAEAEARAADLMQSRSLIGPAQFHYSARPLAEGGPDAGPPRSDNPGLATRVERAREAHRGNDPRAGIRAYCAGNRWLEENAKAVGNW